MVPVLAAPKLIYLIRDPVARAVSHYIHEWSRNGIAAPLGAALRERPEIADYGRYGMQIAPFAAAYGARNIFLTSLERMTAAPQETLSEIGAFLGRPDLVWQDGIGAQNVSAERVRPLPMQRLLVDNPVARALRRRLVPKSLRERIRRSRSMTVRPELSAEDRSRIETLFTQTAKDRAKAFELKQLLDKLGVFREYEDRFLDLFRKTGGGS